MSDDAKIPYTLILEVTKSSLNELLSKLDDKMKKLFEVFGDHLEIDIKSFALAHEKGIGGKEFGNLVFKAADEAGLITFKTPENVMKILEFFNIFNEALKKEAKRINSHD